MGRYEGDKIVKPAAKMGSGSFADLRKSANQQSPVSKRYEDASRYGQGGKK